MQYDESTKTLITPRDEIYLIVRRYDHPTPGWYISSVKWVDDIPEWAQYERSGMEGWGGRGWIDRLLANMKDEIGRTAYFRVMRDVPPALEAYVWNYEVPIEFKTDTEANRVLFVEVSSMFDPRIQTWLDTMKVDA